MALGASQCFRAVPPKDFDSESLRSKKSSKSAAAMSLFSFQGNNAVSCSFHPSTRHGHLLYATQMLTLPFIPIVALIVQNIYTMEAAIQYQRRISDVKHMLDGTSDVGRLLGAIQAERVQVALYIFAASGGSQPNDDMVTPSAFPSVLDNIEEIDWRYGHRGLGAHLNRVFEATDDALDQTEDWSGVARIVTPSRQNRMFKSKIRFQTYLGDIRRDGFGGAVSMRRNIEWYDRANAVFLEEVASRSTAVRGGLDSTTTSLLLAYISMIRAVENLNMLVTLGLRYFALGRLSNRLLARATRCDTLVWEHIKNTRAFSSEVAVTISNAIDNHEDVARFLKLRDQVTSGARMSNGSVTPLMFYQAAEGAMARLTRSQIDIKNIVYVNTDGQLQSARQQQIITTSILVLVLVLASIIICVTFIVASTMESFSKSLWEKAAEIRTEKKKADKLLLQTLPDPVAMHLKGKLELPADYFDCVTIYISDIVDFAAIGAQSTPMQVMNFLNLLYKAFDSLIDRYDVYKVDTIGDTYMCVSGLPNRNGNRHVLEVADMSLAMMTLICTLEIPHLPNHRLQIRSGLHSGPCMAGVVGNKVPRYCLFGDAVIIASEMESSSQAMKMHLSQATHDLLEENGGYNMERKEPIEIQGRSVVSTWWLNGKQGGSVRNVEIFNPSFLDLV